jgi:hypothetical protein
MRRQRDAEWPDSWKISKRPLMAMINLITMVMIIKNNHARDFNLKMKKKRRSKMSSQSRMMKKRISTVRVAMRVTPSLALPREPTNSTMPVPRQPLEKETVPNLPSVAKSVAPSMRKT